MKTEEMDPWGKAGTTVQDCFDYTAWGVFEDAATDLDELTDTDIIH